MWYESWWNMVANFTNFITSSALSNIAQSTTASVSIETGMKAVGRPSFILADKDLEPRTKKYAATKEFLYQAICLGTYMALVIPLFKNGSFKLAKNKIFKDERGFQLFKNAGEFLNYHKLTQLPQEARVKTLNEAKYKDKFSKEVQEILKSEKPEKFSMVKGLIELGNTLGSVLGLAIFAPEVSHLIIHPVMKLLGMEKKDANLERHELDIDMENGKVDVELVAIVPRLLGS